MINWRTDIENARSGKPVMVGWKEPHHNDMQESFIMRWNDYAKNAMFAGVAGMWEALDKSFTWAEEGGYGPTHWAEITEPEDK